MFLFIIVCWLFDCALLMCMPQTSISALYARNLIRPLQAGRNPLEDACPMDDIWQEISSRLAEFEAIKSHRGPSMITEK